MLLLKKIGFLISYTLLFSACTGYSVRDLDSFSDKNPPCYDRQSEPYTAIVDSHIHFRAFGGRSIPFTEISDYLYNSGVLFANIYGIGQQLPVDSSCSYYLDCPGIPVLPGIKNDFVNAANYVEFKPENLHLILSMTFPDLAKPQTIVELIRLYDKEYPGLFKWMGEVNLIKQALLPNQHIPVAKETIAQWAPFMTILRERNIPLNIHADLGNNAEPEKYLELMRQVLSLYPHNKIIWAHMGLSKELNSMNPVRHIAVMQELLNDYPLLMLDISWRVLYDNYFSKEIIRALYVDFINRNSKRILPGTDFVASRKKDFSVYQEELNLTGKIHRYLSDQAFQDIALGDNYFRLLGLNFHAPEICKKP